MGAFGSKTSRRFLHFTPSPSSSPPAGIPPIEGTPVRKIREKTAGTLGAAKSGKSPRVGHRADKSHVPAQARHHKCSSPSHHTTTTTTVDLVVGGVPGMVIVGHIDGGVSGRVTRALQMIRRLASVELKRLRAERKQLHRRHNPACPY